MNTAADSRKANALDLRFGQVGLLQLRLRTVEAAAVRDELVGRIASAPQFFVNTAVCLDLSALPPGVDPAELVAVIEAIRAAGLLTVGVADTVPEPAVAAAALGLPVLGGFRQLSRPPGQTLPKPTREIAPRAEYAAPTAAEPAAEPAPVAVVAPLASAAPPVGALVHNQPIRSGQRIYGRDRDVVVLGTVGAGAEVMADGCVHVYGSLRGRVLAGVRGDTAARVFCLDFRAELVAINGIFRVFETLPPELQGQPVMAWLDGEELRFARLGG
jgi:septum site-determining protein MinC